MISMLSNMKKNLAPILALYLVQILISADFVSSHKIQAEEECLSANILCYECDSRYDINCADPFDFSSLFQPTAQIEGPSLLEQITNRTNTTSNNIINDEQHDVQLVDRLVITDLTKANSTNSKRKKLPAFATCHGCCVKITSKTHNGATYVRRTCTTSLQINYFMVGLVCMKESGDRGKMCFCETDFCNGQPSKFGHGSPLFVLVALLSVLKILDESRRVIM